MAERNPELASVNDHEIAVRISLLLAVVDAGTVANDERVYRPLEQIQVLLDELKARYPKPDDQVVQLATLRVRGAVNPA